MVDDVSWFDGPEMIPAQLLPTTEAPLLADERGPREKKKKKSSESNYEGLMVVG